MGTGQAFPVGTKVCMVDNDNYETRYTIGKVYTVVESPHDDFRRPEGIYTVNDDGKVCWTYAYRWEEIKEDPKVPEAPYSLIECEFSDLKAGDWFTWGSQSIAFRIIEVSDGVLKYSGPEINLSTGQVEDCWTSRLFYSRMGLNLSKVVPLSSVTPHDRIKGQTPSDGGSTDYYKLPEHATELRHLISHKGMSKSRGDIFKACYRLGEKQGVDVLYDLNKIKFFIEDLIEMHGRGEHI